MPIDDPAAREVVRRELDVDPVAWQDLDPVAPHLARGVAERLVAVVELDLVHAVAECLDDLALELDLVFLACDGRHLLENDPRAAAKASCRGAGELVGLTKSRRRWSPLGPLRPHEPRTRPSRSQRES